MGSQVSNLPSIELSLGPAGESFDPAVRPELFEGVIVRRVVAYLIDVLFIGLLFIPAGAVAFVFKLLSAGFLTPVIGLFLLLIPLAYHTATIGGPSSATPGMALMGVEVRRLDGGHPDYILAGIQTVMFYASVMITTWLVLLVALFNGRGRTVHDFLCGTITVRTPGKADAAGRD